MKKILVLNGMGLLSLDASQPVLQQLESINTLAESCVIAGHNLNFNILFKVANNQKELIQFIAENSPDAIGIVINVDTWDYVSEQFHEAIISSKKTVIEVSTCKFVNCDRCCNFTHKSRFYNVVISGFGMQGYALAIQQFDNLRGKN